MEKELNKQEDALEQRSLATEGTQETSIDFGKIFKDLLKHKKLYLIVLPIAFLVAYIYGKSLPDYYKCKVMLAPESGGAKSGSGILSLASSFGINLGGGASGSGDAIGPTLYPDLMNAVDFKTNLFEVKVTRGSDNKTFTYYDYLRNEQKYPWWEMKSKPEEEKDKAKVNPFKLTPEQSGIAGEINKNVVCDIDKKTGVINIEVTDQDPLICATLADSVKTRLQKFITDYRTSKVRIDWEYNKKLFGEAKVKYENARDRYVSYSDSHRNVSSQSAQTKQADLRNEMEMQQAIYQQVVVQLQQAEMKVQQETPAFTTLQSATVPVGPAGPNRKLICLIVLSLAFLATTIYILYKEDDVKPLLGLS